MQNLVTNFLHQHTKNLTIILLFTMYPTYNFMEFVSFLNNEVDDTFTKELTIDMFPKTICEKYGANVLTLC